MLQKIKIELPERFIYTRCTKKIGGNLDDCKYYH